MQDPSTHRAFQLSYLRALVTLLVVAHHTALAYVTFIPPRSGFTAALLWTAFPIADARRWPGFDVLVGWNDIFFMALMFFVSGLFVWPGLKRHGAGTFIRRRFLRLGVPFVVAAGLLAPLAYYPAYLQLGGSPYLGGYASAWLTLGKWPAGPAWFLWVLLMFDCVAALFFTALPQAVEALARGVRTASDRPLLLFLMLAALSFAAYVPMATHFGGQTWWSWGPFFVQSSRVLHYFVYFAMGVCLGAFGTEIPIFERTGRLAQRWWLWSLGMVVAFLVLTALVLTGKFAAARMVFPVSCAASSLFLAAVVIRWARPWRWADNLSANAYGIYLLHYLFVIWIQYAALHWTAPAIAKGAAVLVAATGLSWMAAGLLRQSKVFARVV
ncbi:MAG: acyltransferase [Acidobacteriaceae bacterium]